MTVIVMAMMMMSGDDRASDGFLLWERGDIYRPKHRQSSMRHAWCQNERSTWAGREQ